MRAAKLPLLSTAMDVSHGAPEGEEAAMEAGAHAGHDHHDDEYVDPESMNPQPSFWPFILSMVTILIPIGTLLLIWAGPELTLFGWGLIVVGTVLALVPTMGWFHSVIVDKWEGHFGAEAQGRDLTMGTLLFFLSEIAIFGSLFAYYFVQRYHSETFPPPGTPPIPIAMAGIGLLVLMISSVTCEFAHKAVLAGKRGLAKNWLLLTMALGTLFIFMQGYEYGIIIYGQGLAIGDNWFSTIFFAITGFHGIHVMTGLIMLMIVYARLEYGHFTRKRHFSMQAASWYWHLVDVVWIFVFIFVYAMQEPLFH